MWELGSYAVVLVLLALVTLLPRQRKRGVRPIASPGGSA